MQLSSGKFAVVEKSREFTLVPWRLVIDRQLGRDVAGMVQGDLLAKVWSADVTDDKKYHGRIGPAHL